MKVTDFSGNISLGNRKVGRQNMVRFGGKDTRFPGAREVPERPETGQDRNGGELVRFHNWVDTAFQARSTLARFCFRTSRKT